MFLNVFSQVLILIILIFIGFAAAKMKILTEEGVKCCTDIALLIATPCVIIKSLIREFDSGVLKSLSKAVLLTLAVQLLMIVLSRIIFHSKNKKREKVLQFGSIFANCGFMSLPLQNALLGADGMLYGSAYVIMFNLVVWSYGVYLMSGDKKYISPKKMFVNPGLIGLVVGIIIFVFSIPIPHVVSASIDYIAALYTPLPMLVIGYHLSKSNILGAFKDAWCIIAVFTKGILYPLASLGFLYLIGVRGTLLTSIIISVSAPVAAITTMFSFKFDVDTPLSVDMVSLSTVLSIATMPLMITLAQYIG